MAAAHELFEDHDDMRLLGLTEHAEEVLPEEAPRALSPVERALADARARMTLAPVTGDDACVNLDCADGQVHVDGYYRPCPDCQERTRMGQLRRDLIAANIPESDLDVEWDRINQSHLSWQQARRYCDHIAAIAADGYNALLAGPPGRGKSLAGVCIARAAVRAGLSARIVTAQDLIGLIMRTYRDDAPDTEYDVVNRLAEVDVLILDDLDAGATKNRTTEIRVLTGLIDKREKAKRPTVITTNLMNADEIETAMGFRALDRVRYKCAQMVFDGPNERQIAHRASVAHLEALVMGEC